MEASSDILDAVLENALEGKQEIGRGLPAASAWSLKGERRRERLNENIA
jgi:hypothetical protein